MNRSATIFKMPQWLAILLAVVVMLAPVISEAAHIDDHSKVECELCLDQSDTDAPNHHQHKDQHVHGCGTCHVHIFANVIGFSNLHLSSKQAHFALTNIDHPSAERTGLFRPPRF